MRRHGHTHREISQALRIARSTAEHYTRGITPERIRVRPGQATASPTTELPPLLALLAEPPPAPRG